jgi:hypothetical protein
MTFLKVIGHNLRIKKNDKRSGDKKNYLKDKEIIFELENRSKFKTLLLLEKKTEKKV